MSLLEDIDHCFKTALKNQDQLQLSTLRLLKTALKNRQVQARRPLTEAEVVAVITSQVKQRRDSIVEYERVGRSDLARKEQEELQFLLSFLPQQLATADLEQELARIIKELQAVGPQDLGRVMKAAMAKLAGRVDGREVQALVKKMLAG
ncbi:MAG: GatB/YqeY domain-containing protein [Desulfobacca sp.]|uniref:GatB/YqeY domain-containing protein n=1 Tax=Desulfobacca sp. TaxID=2067990 RepID=UPI00404AC000